MESKILNRIIGTVIVIVVFCINLNAQGRNDVIKVYNEGAKAVQTDIQTAIASFENVVALSEQVGESVDDLKQKAMKVLPGLYIKAASSALSEKKPGTEIVQASKEAVAAAEKYESPANKETAEKLLVQGYYAMGIDYFNSKDYDNALLAFDSLLKVNPDYITAIFNKALIYRSQNNPEAFEETINMFIERAKSENDEERVKQGSALALEYFRAAGSQANQAENLSEAVDLLNKAANYGDDKDLFYYYADVYNKQKKFDLGAEYAQKGLDLESGNAGDKAKYYYQLAVAQAGNGDNANACGSFKNALYGPFAEASKAQMKNLKCE